MVVTAPISASVAPVASAARLLMRRLASNATPAPRATRVPTTKTSFGMLNNRSCIIDLQGSVTARLVTSSLRSTVPALYEQASARRARQGMRRASRSVFEHDEDGNLDLLRLVD